MKTLVLGATGATGRLLVEQLLQNGQRVKIIVRSNSNLSEQIRTHENLSIITASILELSDDELVKVVSDCDAVVSCLGHNLSFKGLFGAPRRLVTDATANLCKAIVAKKSGAMTKFLLMNTAGNSNRDLREPTTLAHRCVIGLLRLLLPPPVDNEQAADYLRVQIGQTNGAIEWVAVRPDSLINDEKISEYDAHKSPTRCAIFNPGQTSRMNVAHFIAQLIVEDKEWNKWKGQMPVIYNRA